MSAGQDSSRGVAYVPLYALHVGESDQREHQGASGSVGPYRFAAYAFGLHPTDAEGAAAIGKQDR